MKLHSLRSLLLALASLLAVRAFAESAAPAAAPAKSPAPAVTPPPYREDFGKLKSGAPLPDFDLLSADGKPAKFSDYAKGKTTIIGVWMAGSGPSPAMLTQWNDLATAYAAQGVVFLGIGGYDTREAFEGWLAKNRDSLKFPVAMDPAGKLAPAAKTRAEMTPDELKAETARSRAFYDTIVTQRIGGVMSPIPTTIAVKADGTLAGWSSGFGTGYRNSIGNLLLRAGVKVAAADMPDKVYTAADFAAARAAAPVASSPRIEMLKVGMMAPDFTTQDLAGKPVKLSDFRGKIVVLDFWATWCGPCIASMPHTNEVAKNYKDQGVVVLGSCTSDTRAAFEKWVKTYQEKYPDFIFTHDPLERSPDNVSRKLYGVGGIPQQFIIDRDGKIAALCTGYLAGEVLLEGALAQAGVKVAPEIVAKAKVDQAKRDATR